MARFWHYTSALHLTQIVKDGYIKTTDSMLDPVNPTAGPPCVWLLDTPGLLYSHGLDGSAVDKTAVRIEVNLPEDRVVRWFPWAEAAGMPSAWMQAVMQAGGGADAAIHWWLHFRRIPIDKWRRIDVRQPDGSWTVLEADDLKQGLLLDL